MKGVQLALKDSCSLGYREEEEEGGPDRGHSMRKDVGTGMRAVAGRTGRKRARMEVTSAPWRQ